MTTSPKDDSQLEEQAILIAGEIFNLIYQYTNDSHISKFFLTDEVARACYGLAGGFSSVIYTPVLNAKETKNSAILSFIYALMTYGFNIFLKERSLLTNAAPYRLPINRPAIRKVQRNVLAETSSGELLSTPLADKIIKIIIENVREQMDMKEFAMKGHRMNKTKFWDYTRLSLYWGYNFARGLLPESMQNTKVASK